MKILFIDTETTGLDPDVNGIHQLAGEIMINGIVTGDFNYYLSPFDNCRIDEDALKVSDTSTFDLLIYPPEQDVFIDFYRHVKHYLTDAPNDKIFLAGWRLPEFDIKFIKALFDRNNASAAFKTLFWSNPIDIKVLATQYLINRRQEMTSFSLESVAGYLDIKVDSTKLHSASYDAYLCRKVYEIVTIKQI